MFVVCVSHTLAECVPYKIININIFNVGSRLLIRTLQEEGACKETTGMFFKMLSSKTGQIWQDPMKNDIEIEGRNRWEKNQE